MPGVMLLPAVLRVYHAKPKNATSRKKREPDGQIIFHPSDLIFLSTIPRVPEISSCRPMAWNLFPPVFGVGTGAAATGSPGRIRDLALWKRRLYFISGVLGAVGAGGGAAGVMDRDFRVDGLVLPFEVSGGGFAEPGDHISEPQWSNAGVLGWVAWGKRGCEVGHRSGRGREVCGLMDPVEEMSVPESEVRVSVLEEIGSF